MTDIEKIRLKIGDLTISPHYDDAQIQMFLDEATGSVSLASALALEAWAAAYAMNPSTEKIGDYSYGQNIVDNMLKLAEVYRTEAQTQDVETPILTWAAPALTGLEDE